MFDMKYPLPEQAKHCTGTSSVSHFRKLGDTVMLHGAVVPVLWEIEVSQLGRYAIWQRELDCTSGYMVKGWKGESPLPAKALSQAVGHLLPSPCFSKELVA